MLIDLLIIAAKTGIYLQDIALMTCINVSMIMTKAVISIKTYSIYQKCTFIY